MDSCQVDRLACRHFLGVNFHILSGIDGRPNAGNFFEGSQTFCLKCGETSHSALGSLFSRNELIQTMNIGTSPPFYS